MLQKGSITKKSQAESICPDRSSANGASASLKKAWPVLKISQGPENRVLFPPKIIVAIKAIACELPQKLGLPLSRLSRRDIARHAVDSGIVASISGTTIWRWLSSDAIKPWHYRSWIFPRDPHFLQKAEKVLDLYHRLWKNKPLGPDEFVICADEKTSIQARRRKAAQASLQSGVRRVEHEYERCGSLTYLAAWDVHTPAIFGICTPKTGIIPFHQLVDHVMRQPPYSSARRVFWITDNGSSHNGQRSIERMANWYPNAVLVHTPVHASWLNQVEIYFSIVQRKVLMPNDFPNLKTLEQTLLNFQSYYMNLAKPFKWRFTSMDLKNVLSTLAEEKSKTDILKMAA